MTILQYLYSDAFHNRARESWDISTKIWHVSNSEMKLPQTKIIVRYEIIFLSNVDQVSK